MLLSIGLSAIMTEQYSGNNDTQNDEKTEETYHIGYQFTIAALCIVILLSVAIGIEHLKRLFVNCNHKQKQASLEDHQPTANKQRICNHIQDSDCFERSSQKNIFFEAPSNDSKQSNPSPTNNDKMSVDNVALLPSNDDAEKTCQNIPKSKELFSCSCAEDNPADTYATVEVFDEIAVLSNTQSNANGDYDTIKQT